MYYVIRWDHDDGDISYCTDPTKAVTDRRWRGNWHSEINQATRFNLASEARAHIEGCSYQLCIVLPVKEPWDGIEVFSPARRAIRI